MRLFASAVLLVVPFVATAPARADDPSAALRELKEGYKRRQEGDCGAAVPHLLASYRLAASSKALLNLADCESKLGDLVSAKLHATEGRDLARQGRDGIGMTPDDAELASAADDLVATIDKRLPRLAVRLAAGVLPDCTVLRDEVVVDVATLGTPVAANPGPHTIVVKAAGHDDRTYQVSLSEGQRSELLVEPGPALPAIPSNPYSGARQGDGGSGQRSAGEHPTPSSSSSSSSLWATITATSRNEASAALVAGGTLAVGIASAFGIAAISKNNESNANDHCNASGCDSTGVVLRNTALSDATWSSVFFGVGLAAIAGGVVLYLTAPKPEASGVSVELAPLTGLRGTW